MSSESNGRKPDSLEPSLPPSSAGRRQSPRAPSAWGAARDALAAVHNLEALLRSSSVTDRTILDLLPELRSSARVLRDVFEAACRGDAPTSAVGAYGRGRVEDLAGLLDAAAAPHSRDDLASRAHTLADELEASADLLALLERASAPVLVEVSVDLIVREGSRMSSSGSGREVGVLLDAVPSPGVVTTDPYVVGSLLLLLVGSALRAGIDSVVVRTRSAASRAMVIVEAATARDAALPKVRMRVRPVVPPSDRAARRVVEQIGAGLEIDGARCWRIVLACASG